jgi:hypothetical protein
MGGNGIPLLTPVHPAGRMRGHIHPQSSPFWAPDGQTSNPLGRQYSPSSPDGDSDEDHVFAYPALADMADHVQGEGFFVRHAVS